MIDGGSLQVTDSAITGNTSAIAGGGFTVQSITANANATLLNDTISGNTTQQSYGGGVANYGSGPGASSVLSVTNCTIADNTASTATGGGIATVTNSGTQRPVTSTRFLLTTPMQTSSVLATARTFLSVTTLATTAPAI